MPILIKRVLINSFISSIFFLIIGIATRSLIIIFGLVSGSLMGMLLFYMTYKSSMFISYSKDKKRAVRHISLDYAKRFLITGIFLFTLIKFLSYESFLCGVLGLFVIRVNIFVVALIDKYKS